MSKQLSSVPLNKKVVISFANVYQQNFGYRHVLLKYILSNASFKVVKKLYFTCKYFPQKYQLYLIDKIEYDDIVFMINSCEKKSVKYLKLYNSISGKIWFGNEFYECFVSSPSWIAKIGKSTIKKLEILYANLLWDDYKMLANEGTTEALVLINIVNSLGQMVPLEDICALVPKQNYYFTLESTSVTTNTMKEIYNSHNCSTKIKKFIIKNLDGPLNAEDYLEFIGRYKCPEGIGINVKFLRFVVAFGNPPQYAIPTIQVKEFFDIVKSEIEKWSNPKPRFVEF